MKKIVLSLMLAAALTACQRADEPENATGPGVAPAPAAAQATAPTTASVEAKSTGVAKVTLEPSTFESCTPNKFISAKVGWDASASGVGIVDVKTVAADGSETLFATSGAVGSKETGPWIGPGSVIVVRNHDTGAELGRVTAGAKPCGS